MDEIFRRLIANNFSDLPGLRVEASIPLSERLLNEILQSLLAGNRSIHDAHAAIGRDNHVTLTIKSSLWPWPLNLKLKLFSSVELNPSPKIRAFLENNVLLGKLGSLFKALPQGITMYENQVAIDLGSFLTLEQKRLLGLVKSIDIHTEEGKMILVVSIVK